MDSRPVSTRCSRLGTTLQGTAGSAKRRCPRSKRSCAPGTHTRPGDPRPALASPDCGQERFAPGAFPHSNCFATWSKPLQRLRRAKPGFTLCSQMHFPSLIPKHTLSALCRSLFPSIQGVTALLKLYHYQALSLFGSSRRGLHRRDVVMPKAEALREAF